jgi:hypothetical protein
MNHTCALSVCSSLLFLPVALPAQTDTTPIFVLEAEQAVLQGEVEVESSHRNFTGTGYAVYVSEGTIDWTVNIAAPALYQLEFRYSVAVGADSNRPLNIFKNQSQLVAANVSFLPTRTLDEWSTYAVFTKLEAGQNTFRLATTGLGGPNIDHLRVSLTPPDPDKFLGIPLHSSHAIFQGSDADTQAYYKTLDPLDRKTTLDGWKQANDFTSCNAPTCTHVVYFNDVDLGFGRSLFLKVASNGDVVSYLQNYALLSDAVLNRSVLATVAMEFARPVDQNGQELTTPRFTKFYVFDAQGNRINKIDLDGRGVKFVPGLCNSCHGGKPKPADTVHNQYFDRGDTGARFIAWDLDTFRFHASLPRAAQEDEFKRLNQAVLLTSPPSATRIVIDGWYGGAGMPSATFDGSFVPPGWQQNGAEVENLYREVVAPSCRSCHNQRGSYNAAGHPVLDGPKEQTLEFNSFADFTRYAKEIESLVYEQGLMPLAKRTFDRFWRQGDQPRILDDVLFGGLAYQNPPAEVYPGRAVFAFGALRRPGRPIARIAASRLGANSFPYPLFFLEDVEDRKRIRLHGASSTFASQFSWSIESGPGPDIPVLTGADAPQAFFDPSAGSSDILNPASQPYLVRFGVTNAFADYNEVIRGQLFSDSRLQPLTFTEDIYPLLNVPFNSTSGSTLSCIHCHSNGNVVSHADSIFKLRNFDIPDEEGARRYAYELMLTRVNCNDPENSLILKKPAEELPHYGGRINVFAGTNPYVIDPALLDTGDTDAKARILRWIMEGAPYDVGSPARCPPPF